MAEEKIDPHAVERITVRTTTRGADILSDPSKYDPQTKETADHSLPYCIAVAVAKGNVLPSDFTDEAIHDPFVRSFLRKIEVIADPEIDALFPKVKRAVVTITTVDGKSFTKIEDHAKGRAERPMTDAELIAKFKANAGAAFPESRLDEIVAATLGLEEISDVRDFVRLLVR